MIPFIGVFLASQTAGAILSNGLWGWWGDRYGKLSLLRLVSSLNAIAPAGILVWMFASPVGGDATLYFFTPLFFVLGAVGNGRAIAYIGYLMEISPDQQRPAYSGYFNALVAPASLLPMLGAAIAVILSFQSVFTISLIAALTQVFILNLPPDGRSTLGKH